MSVRTAATQFERPSLTARAADAVRHWRYAGERRDLRLDLLRGFAAFAMIVDHVGGRESWLYAVTGGNRFFVSAAEAFVLISGMVLGVVYLGVVERHGIGAALMKALSRAWMLYVVTVLLTLGFASLSSLLGLPWAAMSEGGVGAFVVAVATLHRTYFLVDVLLMYALLLLIAGPVILLLSQGRWAVVLIGSWLIWGLWQMAPQWSSVFWEIEGNPVFNMSAWQVIFVNGIVIGWHRASIERLFARLPRAAVTTGLGLAVVTATALYALQIFRLELLQSSALLSTFAFDKPDLVIGRLVVLVLLSAVAFAATTTLWTPLNRALGWLLLPLGQHALTAYSLHIFVVALTAKLSMSVLAGVADTPVGTLTLQLGAVGVVWLVVRFEGAIRDALRRAVPHVVWRPLAAAGELHDGMATPRA